MAGKISGYRRSTIEFTLHEACLLGDLFRLHKVEVNGGTVIVDGMTLSAAQIDSYSIGPDTKEIKLVPGAKGGTC